MTTLSTFDPFARLPIELRLKIWHAALPARVVEPDIDCDCMAPYTTLDILF